VPDVYKAYEQQHDKPAITDIGLATEKNPDVLHSPFLSTLSLAKPSFDSYDYSYDSLEYDTPTESNAKPLKQLSPIVEDPYSVAKPIPSYYNYTTPPPPLPSNTAPPVPPKITVSEPNLTPSPTKPTRVDGNISLQEDLENLLQNLEEHYKRRPSGIPKAPPPSPADEMSPNSMYPFTLLHSFFFF
jgi:hypothetical protein